MGFFSKPFRNQDLIDAIKEGIARDRETRKQLEELAKIHARYDSLTSREREVFALVTDGSLNKQIAHQLGTSERTIKAHRAQVVQKMKADSVADLVRMADRLKNPAIVLWCRFVELTYNSDPSFVLVSLCQHATPDFHC